MYLVDERRQYAKLVILCEDASLVCHEQRDNLEAIREQAMMGIRKQTN
jgi:hypothetical protein